MAIAVGLVAPSSDLSASGAIAWRACAPTPWWLWVRRRSSSLAALVPGEAESHSDCGSGRLGDRLSRRWTDFPRGLERRVGRIPPPTLWRSAAIGVLAGAGYPLYATVATGFVVFINLACSAANRQLHQPSAFDFDRTRNRISHLRHMPQPRRSACPRAAPAGPCRRFGTPSSRQQRSRRNRSGYRDRLCVGAPACGR